MDIFSSRTQLRLVALGYAIVFAMAAAMLYMRHLQELRYPADASGGMWAAGDLMLYIFIACLFLVPTFFLIWVISKLEAVYKVYSQLLLGLSLTAPFCLGALYVGENYLGESVASLCLYRMLWSPFILLGMGVSRLAARSDQAKRLAGYALSIEALVFASAIALLIHHFH